MKSVKVISYKNLPVRIPIGMGVVLWLFLDRLQVPAWVYAVAFTLYGILFIGCVAALFSQTTVDILGSKNSPP